MKGVLLAIGGFIGLLLLIMALSFGGSVWRYVTAEWFGIVDAEVQLESAPSRISNYNYFFDLCTSIQGHEASLQAQLDRLERMNPNDPNRSRVEQNVTALQAQRGRDIARYNNDASKDYTAARFLASNLPFRLDVNAPSTTCAAPASE